MAGDSTVDGRSNRDAYSEEDDAEEEPAESMRCSICMLCSAVRPTQARMMFSMHDLCFARALTMGVPAHMKQKKENQIKSRLSDDATQQLGKGRKGLKLTGRNQRSLQEIRKNRKHRVEAFEFSFRGFTESNALHKFSEEDQIQNNGGSQKRIFALWCENDKQVKTRRREKRMSE